MDDAAFALTMVTALGAVLAAFGSLASSVEMWRTDQRRVLETINARLCQLASPILHEELRQADGTALIVGGPGKRGKWFMLGQELRGIACSAYCELPLCEALAGTLIGGKEGVPESQITEALAEVQAQLKRLGKTRSLLKRVLAQ